MPSAGRYTTMAFNLPPGCSIRDIEGPPRTCKACDEPIDEDAESELCWHCELDKEYLEHAKANGL